MSTIKGIDIIRRWVIQTRLKEQTKQGGVMITLPPKNFVDLNTSITADRLLRSGIDIDQLTTVGQVDNLINQININSMRRSVISQDDPRFKGIMEQLMGKKGEVVDMRGQKIPPGSKIMGGKEVKGTSDRDRVRNEMKTKYGFTDERLNEIENTPIDEEMADRLIAETDLPPPGSRGGAEDIAAPVQSSEESLKNMIQAENKKNITAMKKRKMLEEAIEDASPGFANDTKVDAELVAENLAERMGLVYDDLPTKQRLDLYDQAYTGLSKQRFKGMKKPDDPEEFQKGGIARIGLKEGLTPKQQGPMGPVFTTSDPKEAAKEVVKRLIKIEGADIPVSDKLRISLQGLDKATVQGVMKILGGELSFGAGKQGSDKGVGLSFYKSFEKGGIARIGLKDGMNRRTFLKLLTGAISIPIIGKFFKPVKGVGKVAKVPMIKTSEVPGKPEWFDSLVNKVILEGDDVTKKLATKDREVVHTKKIDADNEVTVYRDLDTDSIRVDYTSPDVIFDEPVSLTYTRGQADETTKGMKPADEFETFEQGIAARSSGPDDYSFDIEPNVGSKISDLESDVSKLKEYATGKGPTMKEFIASKKRKDRVRKLNEGDIGETSDYVTKRQGDYYDYDDYKKGGLAGMLGE